LIGRHETPEGSFTGSFKAGFLEGKGKTEYKDGSAYDGHFQTGRRHGKGTYTNPMGYITQYTGDWAYDTREGQGEFTFSNGDRYVGPVSGGMVRFAANHSVSICGICEPESSSFFSPTATASFSS